MEEDAVLVAVIAFGTTTFGERLADDFINQYGLTRDEVRDILFAALGKIGIIVFAYDDKPKPEPTP